MAQATGGNSGEFLPTRRSLLERLKDLGDQSSWKDFFETYWKLIYSVARKAGLSDADAQDVVQETVITVSRRINDFNYDPKKGSFKGWLKRVTNSRLCDLQRKKQYQVKGRRLPREERLKTSLVENLPDQQTAQVVDAVWDREWKAHILEIARGRVKGRLSPKQYQLYYWHVVKEVPAQKIAQRMGVKPHDVYNAKYRVEELVTAEVKLLDKGLNRTCE